MATEKRLIDADELRDLLDNEEWLWLNNTAYYPNWLIDACIATCHTVDAVEVVHGRWIWRGGCFHCSNCKTSNDHTPAYCEGCGAMMDGDGNG